MADSPRYRLVTRSDFDGLACAMLLKSRGMIDDVLFAHPKDVQDGKVAITGRDITTNLPYSPLAHMVFDHHASESVRLGGALPANLVLDPDSPSAARVVFRHFGGAAAFPHLREEMLAAVDKADSAQFTVEEVLDPTGWVLLSFLMDARTGLGRFRTFTVSNYQLMMELIDAYKQRDVAEILALPNVAERVTLYREQQELFKAQVQRCSAMRGNVVVMDTRKEEVIHAGNRFVVYALFPKANISVQVLWGLKQQNTVFAIGKSIFDRTSKTDVGDLCLRYGGGGHHAAGTCQVANDRAAAVLEELVTKINADG
ncbi:MAG: exopolyphosphatase [Gemmatimonadetes bacterium]|nr:exopolyphosphatase [Gemmatimonadota bacterium]